jgi:hypothetical protein
LTVVAVLSWFCTPSAVAADPPYRDHVKADAPWTYFQLEDASGAAGAVAADGSGNARHGRYVPGYGAPAIDVGQSGKIGRSAHFTNLGYVGFDGNSTFGPTLSSFTAEMWFRTGSGQTSSSYPYLFRAGAFYSSGGSWRLSGGADPGRLQVAYATDFSGWMTFGPRINDGKWHHLAVTRQANSATVIYVDGSSVGQTAAGGLQYSGALAFGNSMGASSSGVDLFVDEAAVYTYALSPSRIALHASSAEPPVVDLAKPTVSLAGDLWDAQDYRPIDIAGDADISIDASDSGSGVVSSEVLVDGQPGGDGYRKTQSCTGGGCSMHHDFLFKPTLAGDHLVSVVVKDLSGNTERIDWHIDVEGDVGPPPPDEDPDAPSEGPTRGDTGSADLLPCEVSGSAVPFETFSLGSSFESLLATRAIRRCDVPYPDEPVRANFVTYIYGDCSIEEPEADDERCVPPLEIQTWPACERALADYSFGPEGSPLDRTDLTVQTVPAAVFEDGYRLEIYTGESTVVVFGVDAAQVLRAGDAVRRELTDPPLPPAAQVQSGLSQPAPGSTTGLLPC